MNAFLTFMVAVGLFVAFVTDDPPKVHRDRGRCNLVIDEKTRDRMMLCVNRDGELWVEPASGPY